jgi:copper chaperone CopZ
MKHTYQIQGMTCNGCRSHVEKALSAIQGVDHAYVDLKEAVATIEMSQHLSIEAFQEALKNDGGRYSIYLPGMAPAEAQTSAKAIEGKGTGTFYCPMQCEGDKIYDQQGDCPVCGMDLVEEMSLTQATGPAFTCPMHPEIIENVPGTCHICGMDLISIVATASFKST